jgi:RimJ/RimL family protein N-acetyltransferase
VTASGAVTVRHATVHDAPALGRVHVRAWQAADRWGTGAGRALLLAAHAQLARLGYAEAVLWVLPGNRRARRFYEAAGWVADGAERSAEVQGVVVPEVRYRRRLEPAAG